MIGFPAAERGRIRVNAARALAILGVAVALSGCQTGREIVNNYPADERQRHPITIREGERTVELFIGAKRGTLTPTQQANVVAFAHAWLAESSGGIVIDVPAGTSNARAAADALHEIRSMLTAVGVPPAAIKARAYRPATPVKLATVRLTFPRMVAEAGPCGLWPKDLGPTIDSGDRENRPYWNFGCSQQRNLAAMVEDPADLVQPRGETSIYAGRRSVVLEKYRKGEGTATVYPDADKGKISETGK